MPPQKIQCISAVFAQHPPIGSLSNAGRGAREEIYYKRAKLSLATGSQAHFDQILAGEKATLNISEGIE